MSLLEQRLQLYYVVWVKGLTFVTEWAFTTQENVRGTSPIGYMVYEVLFEHEAPFFDDVEQGTLHASAVHSHPPVEHMYRHQTLHLLIDLLIPKAFRFRRHKHACVLVCRVCGQYTVQYFFNS